MPEPPGVAPPGPLTERTAREVKERRGAGSTRPGRSATPQPPAADLTDWPELDAVRLSHEHWRRRRARHRGPLRRTAAIAGLALLAVAAAITGSLLLLAGDPGLAVGCNLASAHPRVVGRDTFIRAENGMVLGAVPTAQNREPVPLERMSPWLPKATVAIEDRRFWQHGALDYDAILRAAIADLKAGRVLQGGSTITQQFVRDRYLAGQGATLHRKLKEACLAVQLAHEWPKRRILQAYLNLVFYGGQAYGAEAAARTFFGRSANSLTLAQAALLAGLPQAPSVYDPFARPVAARARRNEVLRAICKAGYISTARYRSASSSPVRLHPSARYTRILAAPFFNYVTRELVRRLGAQRARRGGLTVETTLDPRLQRLANKAISGWLYKPSDPAAALVAIDPRNGAVRAMTFANPGRAALAFNLASQSHRQAGSAFKVFTLTAAMERGIALNSVWHGPASLTIPNRSCLNANGPWVVHNFADEATGTMTLLRAIAHSVNTIFAQVIMRVGPANVVDVAHRMGIRSHLKPVCALTLGPEGVSPLEMTTAFATLAARGIRHRPQPLSAVLGRGGRALMRLDANGKRALSQSVVDRVTYALTGVVRAGTGRAADPGRPAAGKTGTAENFKDAWFCGYVPQLATCVWIGYPQAEIPMHGVGGFAQVVGGSVPARIWHDFMLPAMAGQPVRGLPTASPGRVGPAPQAPPLPPLSPPVPATITPALPR
ncbi:MAG TPA: transglycosylase domain-containing protein [Thermoleophilaceae bacterium]